MAIKGRKGFARIALLTIIDEEFTAVSGIFNTTVNIPGTFYFVEQISEVYKYKIIVAKSVDRGNHAAGEAVADIVEDFRPEFILLVGIAGGVGDRDNTQLGDLVVADFVAYSEFRKLTKGRSLPRHIPYDHPSLYLRQNFADPLRMNSDWIKLIKVDRPTPGEPKVIIGNIVAGEKLLGDPTSQYQKEVLTEFDKSLAIDMESMGVAREVFKARSFVHYNPQYLVIRGISDFTNAGENNEEQRRLWKEYAAGASAAFARCISDAILAVPESAHEISEYLAESVIKEKKAFSISKLWALRTRAWRLLCKSKQNPI